MKYNKKIGSPTSLLHDRLIILSLVVFFSSSVLIIKLYNLQIINGEYYLRNLIETTVKTLNIPAPRGEIFDVYGRPLAVNSPSFTAQMDAQVNVTSEELNDVIYNTILLFEKNGEQYIDELPISTENGFEFLFDGNKTREERWKKDMALPKSMYDCTAEEAYYYLLNKFDIIEITNKDKNNDGKTDEDFAYTQNIVEYTTEYPEKYLRDILSLRSAHYMQRFKKHTPIVLAYDISPQTMTEIEEQPEKYKSIKTSVEAKREYPTNKETAHMIGYIGKASEDDLETLSKENPDYMLNDIVGKTGIEKSFELELKGDNGSQVVEANNVGEVTNVLESTEPVKGNDVHLTIDSELQAISYDILERYLKDIQINRLLHESSRDHNATTNDFYTSFVASNNFFLKDIKSSEEGTTSKYVYDILKSNYEYDMEQYEQLSSIDEDNLSSSEEDKLNELSTISSWDFDSQEGFTKYFAHEVEDGNISYSNIMIMMDEQGVVDLTDEELSSIRNGYMGSLTFAINMLEDGRITPQMSGLDPYSGSVVVVDVKTGDVIVAANYPSYDNNRFVNNFDNDYYYKNTMLDPTTPMVNRAFMEPRAPGSTFKMLTSIATLEAGVIEPSTLIYDGVQFEKAGKPYPSCWSSSSHGYINVAEALEVSCNYFFFESSYRLGNAEEGTTEEAIEQMNKYMRYFGLGERTGVEIGELADFSTDEVEIIATPEYKRYLKQLYYDDAPESELRWYDGDTIATAIGQSINNYTPASMAKYVATLVNDGVRMQFHLLDYVDDVNGDKTLETEPVIEEVVPMEQENLDVVKQGMWQVVYGPRGTAKSKFTDFPIEIGAKTGTAQESKSRNDHSSFTAFAPYDDPEIVIYTVLPYGNTYSDLSAPAARVSREVLDAYFNLNYQPETKQSINGFNE